MHQGGAHLTKGNKLPVGWRNRPEFGFSKCGLARGAALETIALVRPAHLLDGLPVLQKIHKIAAHDQARPLLSQRRQARNQPAADGAFGNILIAGHFLHRIALMEFNGPPACAARHSFEPVFDQGANVFHPPCGDART